MRKIALGLFTIIAIVMTACAAQKKKTSGVDVSYVQMWRTTCFGKCPSYKIEVYKEGLVRYTGLLFTDTGIYEKNIGTAQAQEILNEFNKKRVDTLQKEYRVTISDIPGVNYTFRYGNTVKEVRYANFGPVFLRELAEEVDRLVKESPGDIPKMDNTWKRISVSPKGD